MLPTKPDPTADQRRRNRAAYVVLGLLAVALAGSGFLHHGGPKGPGQRQPVVAGVSRLIGTGSTGGVQNAAANNAGNTDPTTGCNANGNCYGHDKQFGVDVDAVAGLYPGQVTSLPVTYSNPFSFAIYVTTATVTAQLASASAGTPACEATDLVTGTYPSPSSPGLAVPRDSSTSTTLPIGLKASAPDACKNARWTVTVTAQAVK